MTGRYPPASRKLLVLALDAASPALLRAWSTDGTLPTLGAFMAAARVADSRNVEGLYVGATWPSFSTGLDPAGHGIYWLDRLVPGSYRMQQLREADLARSPTLWERLSDAGRRVTVLDVPISARSPRLNGLQVVAWGDHDIAFPFQTTPASLGRELLALVGPHPGPRACDAPSRTTAEYRGFADQLTAGAAARARLTNHLLAREPWDFAIQVFSETHCAGHQFWHFHDPAHPGYDPAAPPGDLVREVYVAVDRALGDILAGVDPETTVVITTLHGMAPTCGASLMLREILIRLGVMAPAAEATGRAPGGGTSAGGALRAAWRRLPPGVRESVYGFRQWLNQRWLGRGSPMNLDPAGSQCFYLETGPMFAGIRLNLSGREPAGTLRPGAEAERFVEELTRELLAIVRVGTGVPLVRQVHRSADLFQGPRLGELPDLLVEWNLEVPIGTAVAGGGAGAVLRVASPRLGELEMVNRYCRTGEHRIGGLLMVRGPGIVPGAVAGEVSVLDLAPTFAAFLGVAMPGTTGRVVPGLLDP